MLAGHTTFCDKGITLYAYACISNIHRKWWCDQRTNFLFFPIINMLRLKQKECVLTSVKCKNNFETMGALLSKLTPNKCIGSLLQVVYTV